MTHRRARKAHRCYPSFYSSHRQTRLVYPALRPAGNCRRSPAYASSRRPSTPRPLHFLRFRPSRRGATFFGQVVQRASDCSSRGPLVTFEVCSQVVSLPLKSLLQHRIWRTGHIRHLLPWLSTTLHRLWRTGFSRHLLPWLYDAPAPTVAYRVHAAPAPAVEYDAPASTREGMPSTRGTCSRG